MRLIASGSVILLAGSIPERLATCPRPPFTGSASDPMSPQQLLERSRRRGSIPSQSEVYASPNVVRIQRVLPESLFDYFFPMANQGLGPDPANGPYSYYNFLKAAAMWPHFCDEAASPSADLDQLCRKELASMFAHFAQEVGAHDIHDSIPPWRQGLYWFTEMGCSDDPTKSGCEYRGGTCDGTTWQGTTWPCPSGVKYFGRGAKQLSYNFNYGPFSYALFRDVTVLLDDPSLVVAKDTTNGWMALASAFWFYMTPQSPKPSMHDVVAGFWTPSTGDIAGGRVRGFGVLIMIINGGIECGGSVEVQQAANRIEYYQNFLAAFNLPAESAASLTCMRMQQFDASGSGFTPSYWEQSWAPQASCGNSCQLVSYQTGFSIFDDPDNPDLPYQRCLDYYYGATTTSDPSISTTSSTTGPADQSCTTCDVCVAVPGNAQAASDQSCSACGAGTLQTWWPCNVSGLCKCGTGSTTTKPVTSTALRTTSAPPATTASVAPASCATCNSCKAVVNNAQAATDAMCSPCANGLQQWWPCNVNGLCQCDASGPTVAPTTTTARTSTNPCASCQTCEAVPNNYQAATSAMCAPCGTPTLQSWWPCNDSSLCRCKAP